MVQTLTVRANGTATINTGSEIILLNGVPFTDALQAKVDAIESVISAAGISELHVERDTFRQFEHAVSGGSVVENEFGTTVSVSDFDWIMQHVDHEAPLKAKAEADALIALLKSNSEPDLI